MLSLKQRIAIAGLATACVLLAGRAGAVEVAGEPFKPMVGQAGKDVVWVPTPEVLVEKMLDVAKVTPKDFVMDLGSGDGRNIIAAAKRGAHALGVEYDQNMVDYARGLAEKAGVADRAQFMQGDMYQADISKATVMALFLLPENLDRLTPKFLDLRPGTRIVANHFGVSGWTPDETGRADGDCGSWCTWLLYYVPAKVAGNWRLGVGELKLEQKFQVVTGTYTSGSETLPVNDGRLRGDAITFTVGGTKYEGRVNADAIVGAGGKWRAVREN